MLANVQQTTIRPVIEASVAKGALVHTDEYDVYARLQDWSYGHKTVCHGHGEYARDEDGDGFCEVHVNTAEGFWSLLRSWLRPHRGISQEKLPAYLGFFQLVHNARRGHVRQRGGNCCVAEAATDRTAMVESRSGMASVRSGVSSLIASVCM
jgi:transposase